MLEVRQADHPHPYLPPRYSNDLESYHNPVLPKASQALQPLRPTARMLTQKALEGPATVRYRRIVRKFLWKDPTEEQMEGMVGTLKSYLFEDISDGFVELRLDDDEELLSPSETQKFFDNKFLQQYAKQAGRRTIQTDGVVIRPGPHGSEITALCEYSRGSTWKKPNKQKQLAHLNSGQVMTDLLTGHPPEVQTKIGQFLSTIRPDLPPRLFWNENNLRTIFTLTRGRHERGPTRLKRKPKVYNVPIDKDELDQVGRALFEDLFWEFTRDKQHYLFSVLHFFGLYNRNPVDFFPNSPLFSVNTTDKPE